jgi:hypothetical protein
MGGNRGLKNRDVASGMPHPYLIVEDEISPGFCA